jgi:hypothetical protein
MGCCCGADGGYRGGVDGLLVGPLTPPPLPGGTIRCCWRGGLLALLGSPAFPS